MPTGTVIYIHERIGMEWNVLVQTQVEVQVERKDRMLCNSMQVQQ